MSRVRIGAVRRDFRFTGLMHVPPFLKVVFHLFQQVVVRGAMKICERSHLRDSNIDPYDHIKHGFVLEMCLAEKQFRFFIDFSKFLNPALLLLHDG